MIVERLQTFLIAVKALDPHLRPEQKVQNHIDALTCIPQALRALDVHLAGVFDRDGKVSKETEAVLT